MLRATADGPCAQRMVIHNFRFVAWACRAQRGPLVLGVLPKDKTLYRPGDILVAT